MSGKFTAPVQIAQSAIVSISFRSLPPLLEGVSDDTASVSLTSNFNDTPDMQGDHEGVLGCECRLSVNAKWSNSEKSVDTCSAECTLVGLVVINEASFSESMNQEERIRYLRANAVSLLYGKARTAIEYASAMGLEGPKSILAIDPHAYLDSINKDKEDKADLPED